MCSAHARRAAEAHEGLCCAGGPREGSRVPADAPSKAHVPGIQTPLIYVLTFIYVLPIHVSQALRIHLNDEFGEFVAGLRGAFDLLAPGGRIGAAHVIIIMMMITY